MSEITEILNRFPEIDVPLNFLSGIIGVAVGYYINYVLIKPVKGKDYNFAVFVSFCLSCALAVPRKILQFFIDFYTGSNLIKCEAVGDDHWLIRLIGPMGSMPEQRYIFDFSEDLLFSVAGAFVATAVLYICLRLKKKEAFKNIKKQWEFSFKEVPKRCKDKMLSEINKVKAQTNIYDMLIWWCVRALMLYAVITMENKAEATLLGAILVGTFAISILHFITPEGSMFCRINYRVQTLITVIAFFGSYVGNYVAIYSITGRYDTLLHFISGFIGTAAGYYLALTLVQPENRKTNFAVCIFAVSFSLAIIPIHESIEFIGDYIWGTANTGFMWEPRPDILLYKLFGHGAGNEMLIRAYDTVYDMSLAATSSIISFIVLFFCLERKRKNDAKGYKTDIEKQTVTC